MKKTKRVLLFGKKATSTGFGLKGCSHGSRYGGYNLYVYGIAKIIAFEVYQIWGSFIEEDYECKP